MVPGTNAIFLNIPFWWKSMIQSLKDSCLHKYFQNIVNSWGWKPWSKVNIPLGSFMLEWKQLQNCITCIIHFRHCFLAPRHHDVCSSNVYLINNYNTWTYLHSRNHCLIWSCIVSFISGPSTSLNLSLTNTNACWYSLSWSVWVTRLVPAVLSDLLWGVFLGLLGGGGSVYKYRNVNLRIFYGMY